MVCENIFSFLRLCLWQIRADLFCSQNSQAPEYQMNLNKDNSMSLVPPISLIKICVFKFHGYS